MHWEDVLNNLGFLMKGLGVTLQLAVLSIAGSLVLGTVLGVIRYVKIPPFSPLAAMYIEFVRSIPLILFIVFIHFGFLPFILGTSASFFVSACVALIIFTSAYVAEIVRGGLNSIEKGHIDAAVSLGLTGFQRLAYIILPLAFARMMPALVSQFIALIKDTSLASTIGLIELTRSGEIIYERTYHEFEVLAFIALIYFMICFSLSKLSKKIEIKI
ncbi:MAG: hypothetical protein A2Y25_08665 [Candidatus Melainabacteria bacterium GWF2_37_15]|nr:MAG: hypothetical protein A2Y25_08665 [Candidatus Melainabacteria bacterium GWF2_37_15]